MGLSDAMTGNILKNKLLQTVVIFIFYLASTSYADIPVYETQDVIHLGKAVIFLEDSSGDLDIRAIRSKPETLWKACDEDTINFGYTDSAYWLKFSLKNRKSFKITRVLEIAYPVLDYIDVFIYQSDLLQKSFATGDKYPYGKRPINHRNFMFPIEMDKNKTFDVYLRVKSKSSMQIPLILQTENHVLEKNQSQLLGLGIYYGTMIVMALYNLFVFISVRERSYLYYVIYVVFMCLFLAGMNGISFQFLWPDRTWWNDQSLIVCLAVVILFALLFTRNFLALPENTPKLDRFCRHMIIYCSSVLALSFILPYKYGIILLISSAVIMIFASFLIGVYRWTEGYITAKYYTTAWAAMLLGGMILAFNKLGFIPRNEFTEHAVQFGSAIEVILLSFAMGVRLNTEKKERFDAQQKALQHEKEAREAQARSLSIQKKANETLEQNVLIRTRELEKANTKLKELSITDGLTGLNNRRYFNEVYNSEFIRALRDKTPLSFLIIDVDHFKNFNDMYGHIRGDDCLISIADTIKSTLQRDNDFLARYGGEEFCVLLPNTEIDGALHVAENIRKDVEKISFIVDESVVPVTVSIGVACEIPVNKKEANRLLSMADKALYRSKEEGRNRVSLYSEKP